MATDEGGSGDGRGEAKKPSATRPPTDPVIRKKVRARQPTLIGLAVDIAKDAAPPPTRPAIAPEAPAKSPSKALPPSRTDAKLGGAKPSAAAVAKPKGPPSPPAKPPAGTTPPPARDELPRSPAKPPAAGKASPLAFARTISATKRASSAGAEIAKPRAKPVAAPAHERTEPSVEVPLPSARDLGDPLPFEATQSAVAVPPDEEDGFGGSLVGGGFAGPPEAPLEAESTQVNYEKPVEGAAPDEDETGAAEALEASAERRTPVADIAMEPTLPAASMPEKPLAPAAAVEPEDDAFEVPPHDPAAPSTSGDLVVEPTVVVSGDAVQDRPQTYSFDPQSGHLALEEPDGSPTASRASPVLWVALGAATFIGLSGLAFLGWVLLRGDTDAPTGTIAEPAVPVDETGAEETVVAPNEPTPPPSDAPRSDEPGSDEPGSDAVAGEGDETTDEDDDGDDEGDESAPAVGRVIPRAELEGFDLDIPRLARRARRMPVPQRRRTNTRLKTQALRAYRAEDYAEAERLYREAMSYNTWDVASVEGLARTTARLERFPEALAWAELAVERNPRSATAYRVLGDVWRQAGHADEAIAAYRRGLAREPGDRWLRRRLRDAREP